MPANPEVQQPGERGYVRNDPKSQLKVRMIDEVQKSEEQVSNTVVEKELDLPEHELVHVGMCLGYEDVDAPQNSLVTVREPLKEFVTFYET